MWLSLGHQVPSLASLFGWSHLISCTEMRHIAYRSHVWTQRDNTYASHSVLLGDGDVNCHAVAGWWIQPWLLHNAKHNHHVTQMWLSVVTSSPLFPQTWKCTVGTAPLRLPSWHSSTNLKTTGGLPHIFRLSRTPAFLGSSSFASHTTYTSTHSAYCVSSAKRSST